MAWMYVCEADPSYLQTGVVNTHLTWHVVKPKYQLSEKRKQQMRDYSKLDRQFKVLTDPDFLVNQRKKSAVSSRGGGGGGGH